MKKFIKNFLEILLVVLVVLFILAVNWGVTVGVVYLVALCFGFKATLLVATGFWILVGYLRIVFSVGLKPNKKGEV